MIKQNELRLGNWFYDGFVDKEGNLKPAQVRQILEYVREDEFSEPIPLTPEILEKAGFANNKGDFHFQNVVFLRQTGAYFIAKFYVDASSFASSLRRELIIRDVHQLQNLYHALTGEELQINL